MVIPIGEKFWFPLDPDTTLQMEVAKEQPFRCCAGCYFNSMPCWRDSIRQYTGECHYIRRGTVRGVIFKLVDDEKIKKGGNNGK